MDNANGHLIFKGRLKGRQLFLLFSYMKHSEQIEIAKLSLPLNLRVRDQNCNHFPPTKLFKSIPLLLLNRRVSAKLVPACKCKILTLQKFFFRKQKFLETMKK